PGRGVRPLDVLLPGTTPPAEPHFVRGGGRVGAVHPAEGGHVVVDAGIPADVRGFAEGDVVVHAHAARHDDVVLADDVAGDHGVVGDHDIVPDLGVVADVGVDHVEAVVAHAGDAAAFFGADVNGDGLAEDVGVADRQLGRLTFELLVLWGRADDRVGEEDVVLADGGAAQDGDVVEQPAAA